MVLDPRWRVKTAIPQPVNPMGFALDSWLEASAEHIILVDVSLFLQHHGNWSLQLQQSTQKWSQKFKHLQICTAVRSCIRGHTDFLLSPARGPRCSFAAPLALCVDLTSHMFWESSVTASQQTSVQNKATNMHSTQWGWFMVPLPSSC